ncbi:MAG TPA: hypothetical protein VMS76_03205 [Planctomycetota bacterium]|nr:hypothetical protein [Planctomycetota bacterium]
MSTASENARKYTWHRAGGALLFVATGHAVALLAFFILRVPREHYYRWPFGLAVALALATIAAIWAARWKRRGEDARPWGVFLLAFAVFALLHLLLSFITS